jgi:lipopolysaccharide export system protein LptA
MKPLLVSIASAFALTASLFAQPAAVSTTPSVEAPISATPVKTTITASYGEFWTNETETENKAIFKDNVIITGTNMRITCDRVDATLLGKKAPKPASTSDKTTGENVDQFKVIIATGNVRIIQGDREANCERAEVLPREGKIVLTGKPVVVDHGADVTWVGDVLTLLKDERRVMGENVKIVGAPIKDLGFDKNAPKPKPEADAAPAK